MYYYSKYQRIELKNKQLYLVNMICNPMSNTCSIYRGTLDRDDKLSIKSNMNDWYLISDNVCTNIYVLLDLINISEENISCDGFTGEEINFMIYDIYVNWNCILREFVIF